MRIIFCVINRILLWPICSCNFVLIVWMCLNHLLMVHLFTITKLELESPSSGLTVTVMLVTSLCWWLYDGDWFEMLVAESLCWWLFSLCWWFSQCIKSVTNILNRSPTSQTCHQHIWSPTSVTNIDVTDNSLDRSWLRLIAFSRLRFRIFLLQLSVCSKVVCKQFNIVTPKKKPKTPPPSLNHT